ncbi:MAG TPA: hypothetical protein VMH36_19865, partial [Alphaproteobacteria bacterium]|nr:hypothetical protein [Alphaproteobacteria bacterium]
MSKKHAEYEQRLILFLDFLGFKEVVAQTTKEPAHLRTVLRAIDNVRELGSEKSLHRSLRATHFSDSLVISYRIQEQSAVFWLLNQLVYPIIQLPGRGFLLRGAITAGPLLHTKEYLVGPAMVKAYRMESKEAKFPRVI